MAEGEEKKSMLYKLKPITSRRRAPHRTGAKIIRLNLKDDEDKAIYQSTQKLLVLIMIVVESVPQVYGFMEPSQKFIGGMDGFWTDHGQQVATLVNVLQ